MTEEHVTGEEGSLVRLLISDLMPGVKYNMELYTTSYNLDSDAVRLSARTMPQIRSEVVIVNDPQVSEESLVSRNKKNRDGRLLF